MGDLAALIPKSELGSVTNGIYFAVAQSFEEDAERSRKARLPEPRITQAETKRRFDICLKLYRQLRGDLKWGRRRSLDHLPTYLRFELDGVPWEPNRRKLWVPGDG